MPTDAQGRSSAAVTVAIGLFDADAGAGAGMHDGEGRTWAHAVTPVAGRPVLAWTIDAALGAASPDCVFVVTDHPDAIRIAQAMGVRVAAGPDLPPAGSAPDLPGRVSPWRAWASSQAPSADMLAIVTPDPLTTARDINDLLDAFHDAAADEAYSAARPTGAVIAADGSPIPDAVIDTGAVRAVRLSAGRESGFLQRPVACFLRDHLPLRMGRTDQVDLIERALRERARGHAVALLPEPIGAVIFDFDGVFTDNLVTLNQDGVESVTCSRGDGLGVNMLEAAGVKMLVLSKERNPVVLARTGKLRLECLHGVDDKWPLLQRWLADAGVDPAGAIYVGNDRNDLECLENVGLAVVPADAEPAARRVADLVLERPGGRGAVRELAELILTRMGRL